MCEKISFISRHSLTVAQKATLESMGFDCEGNTNITFTYDDPVVDLENAGIINGTIAIVAPNHIFAKLLNKGYSLIEFENEPSKRARGVFVCKGAYKYTLPCPVPKYFAGGVIGMEGGHINMEYFPCPVPIKEQEETSLNYP